MVGHWSVNCQMRSASGMRDAYRAVGPDAVAGFRKVLEAMMEPELQQYFCGLKDTE